MTPFWHKDPPSWRFGLILTAVSSLFFALVPLAIKGAQWGNLELKEMLLPITGIKSLATATLMIVLLGTKNLQFRINSINQFLAMLCRASVNVGWVCVLSMVMPSGTAVLLFFTYPFFALLYSWRTARAIDFIAMIISTIGVGICVGNEIYITGWLGIVIALATAIANGGYVHFISKVKTTEERISSFIWTELLCSFFALPLFWIKESPSTTAWGSMILSGLVMALGMFMLLKAMSKLKGHETSQILLLQPLLTIVIGVLFIGEPISIGVYAGGALILAGCFLRFMPQRQKLSGSFC